MRHARRQLLPHIVSDTSLLQTGTGDAREGAEGGWVCGTFPRLLLYIVCRDEQSADGRQSQVHAYSALDIIDMAWPSYFVIYQLPARGLIPCPIEVHVRCKPGTVGYAV